MINVILGLYGDAWNVVRDGTTAVRDWITGPNIGNPMELQHVNDGQMPNNDQIPEGIPAQPAGNRNNPAAQENGDLLEDIENGPNEAPSTRSKYAKVWMTGLVLGVLSLVIVPGIILGIITKEIPVGIGLSGAIAAVASLAVGLYYHNKRD